MNKLHRVLRVRKGFKNTGMQEDNLLSLSYGRIIRKSIDAAEGLLPESFETYQIVEPGNIVMRLTDLQNDKRSLRQALVKERGIITSAYDALELEKGHDPRFWAYALLALDLAKYYYSMGGGVRQSIKFSDFPNDWISTPDSDTQKAIADFLDRETARIDQLIEKKQRLVELQKIRRLSEVSQLLNRGTRSPKKWKPSGLAWMADIPEHWQWVRMKDVCSEVIDCKNRTPPQVDDSQYWVIRTTCIKDGQFVYSGGYPTDAYSYREWTKRGEPSSGDVLITREAPMGEACLYPDGLSACLGQRMMLYRPDPKLVRATYLVHTIYSAIGQHYIGLRRKGSTVGHLRVPEVYNFPCLLPPLDEQDEILARLDANLDTYTKLGESIRASISHLQEFRSALITAAVTGQIDVATWGKQMQIDRRFDGSKTASPAKPVSPPADSSQVRRLVAAEIIHDHRNVAYLGRIKVHKIMFLAEAHANINEINGRYHRQAAGPYDSAMIDDVEAGLRQDRFYDAAEDPSSQRGRIAFTPLDNAGGHKPTLEAMLGDRVAELRRIIGLVQDFSTENTEAIATLYAVWNDALIDGEQPDDERIIRGFREEWHEAKQRFTEESLRIWLDWMRRNDLVPRGSGPHTISAHQPSLF